MEFLYVFLGIFAFALFITLTASLICFFKIFYSPKRKDRGDDIYVPEGKIYDPFRQDISDWIKKARALPQTDVSITSFDGLRLVGKFYEYKKGAPIELMLHGYRGNGERDMSGGIDRCFSVGHSALVIDHRASGKSDGHVITFGVNESRDCLSWISFIIENIDANAKIILTGISMGAATVMICAGEELPENVIGILADCGYTSGEQIIKKVMRDMKLPASLLYPFARLGGRLFGGFDIDELSPIEAMKSCHLPIIFFHGGGDDFVPFEMSVENFEACASEKKHMVNIEGAGHGLCFPCNREKYLSELQAFFDPITSNN